MSGVVFTLESGNDRLVLTRDQLGVCKNTKTWEPGTPGTVRSNILPPSDPGAHS